MQVPYYLLYQPEQGEIVKLLPFRNTLLPSQSSDPPPCRQSSEWQHCIELLDYLQRKSILVHIHELLILCWTNLICLLPCDVQRLWSLIPPLPCRGCSSEPGRGGQVGHLCHSVCVCVWIKLHVMGVHHNTE